MLISSKKLNHRPSVLAAAWLMKGDTQLENMINPKQCVLPHPTVFTTAIMDLTAMGPAWRHKLLQKP